MLIHSIETRYYRNLNPTRLELSDHANFISGKNGMGKTNLLEAVYWLIALRSKRGTASDCVRTGESGFHLEGEITYGDLKHSVGLTLEGRSRKLTIDGSPPKRRKDYLENVLVVDFFPEDLPGHKEIWVFDY